MPKRQPPRIITAMSRTVSPELTRAEDRALYVADEAALAPALAEIDALRAGLDALKARNSNLWPAVLGKLKVQWTTDSNAIEGSTLTFAETLFFLQHGLTVKGKPFKDHLDARNHADAIEVLFEAVANRRDISEGLIKEINAIILSGVRSTPAVDQFGNLVEKPATPGQYKLMPNHVVQFDGSIHRYVDPIQVAVQMATLVDWVTAHLPTGHPVLVAAIAHYNFVRIHPFDDGNGRGARILMNLILMKRGFPPAVIENAERQDYIEALTAADHGDLQPFAGFVARAVRATLDALIADFAQS